MTAHRCVLSDGSVARQIVLVQGGAGAVGHLAVQIARQDGARVLATVSGPDAAARLRTMGAEPIDRRAEDVAAGVMELTNGNGVDRIIEVDFAANQAVDARLLKVNGTIASYSSTSGPHPILDYYAFASKGANLRFIQGFALPAEARIQAQDWLAAHELHIPIARTFSLDQCAEAHIHVEEARAFGQAVIAP